jgi:hypothetical protein
MTDDAQDLTQRSGPTAVGADRRRAERYECAALQPFWRIVDEGNGETLPAGVLNISATGVGLLLDEPLKPGTVLVISLQSAPGRLSRPLPVRVMHATAQPGGGWLVGCQFVRRLSQQDMAALLGGV